MRIRSTSRIRRNGYVRVIVVLGLLICSGSLFSCVQKQIIHNTINKDEPAIVALKEKYAGILNVKSQDIRNISLYKNIDNWSTVKDSNRSNLGPLNISFVQYLYFLNLKTKLPLNIEDLYKDESTYLYKDCYFLKQSDLVFFKEKLSADKKVGFYLDNMVFVAADRNGELCFHHLQDSTSKFRFISNAKIKRDGK